MKNYDCFSYLRTENPQIDVCLNCPASKCNYGTCELVRKASRDYIIKKTYVTKKGITKTGYLRSVTDKVCAASGNVFEAIRRTEKGAEELLTKAKRLVSEKTKLEVVKRDEEIKRISEEGRKTNRGKCRMHIDANGNRLGR